MESPTVSEFIDAWLELQRSRLQPHSWHEYEGVVRRYVLPGLGATPLAAVTHHDITALYSRLLTSGGLRGKPLSLITVRRIGAIVHKLFADAVRTDLLLTNPCDKATLPRVDLRAEPQELSVWTVEQLTSFLDGERGRPLWPLWVVAAGTGMRRGELLGLRWRDVDLDRHTLHVRRALSVVKNQARLKSPKSRQARSLHVGAAVVDALERVRARQEREATEHPDGQDAPASRAWGLVFTEPDGGHVRPQKVTDTWREAVRNSAQPNIRFHDLRHTHATLLLQAGVNPKVVSGRLGHASIKTTLDLYAEVLPAMDADAAAAFESHVWGTSAEDG